MQSVRMIRMRFQNLEIDILRLFEVTTLVVTQRFFQL